MLLPSHVSAIMNFMEKRPDTGMVGPQGHIVPMTYYLGANEKRVLGLAARMGIGREAVMKQPFVAGSMFFCRVSALSPLLNLALLEDDFETETGQMDGTLAHAIERAFTISVRSAGMRLVGTDYVAGDDVHQCAVRDDYAYAERR